MIIQRTTERISPFVIQPRFDVDAWKTPTQQQLERQAGTRNDQAKRIAQQATFEIYKQMEKTFRNTEYNIRLRIDELSGTEQFELALKKDGRVLASLPPDTALQMAEQAKQQTIGLLFDMAV